MITSLLTEKQKNCVIVIIIIKWVNWVREVTHQLRESSGLPHPVYAQDKSKRSGANGDSLIRQGRGWGKAEKTRPVDISRQEHGFKLCPPITRSDTEKVLPTSSLNKATNFHTYFD